MVVVKETTSSSRTRRLVRVAVRVLLAGGVGTLLVVALLRVERYVLTAACPIVYVADGGRIHLTNEAGTIDVELDGPAAGAQVGRPYSPPVWSPGGEYVAYQCLDAWNGTSHVTVLRPSSGERWVHASRRGARLLGWKDEETWLESERVLDARTGAVVEELARSEAESLRERNSLDEVRHAMAMSPGRTFSAGIICARTADGNILANVPERGRWGLVILDEGGEVLRRIETDVRPMACSGASWRLAMKKQ